MPYGLALVTNFRMLKTFLLGIFFFNKARVAMILGGALLISLSMHVPLVGIPAILISIPLLELPQFAKPNEDIGYWFFGPLLKSWYSWAVFGSYHAACMFLLTIPVGIVARTETRSPQRNERSTTNEQSTTTDEKAEEVP